MPLPFSNKIPRDAGFLKNAMQKRAAAAAAAAGMRGLKKELEPEITLFFQLSLVDEAGLKTTVSNDVPGVVDGDR